MSAPAELSLSTTFKRAQRALDQWLEPNAVHEAAFALRGLLQAVDAAETLRLRRWLHWRSYAARANQNLALLARIEKVQAVFGGKLAASAAAFASRGDRSSLGATKPTPSPHIPPGFVASRFKRASCVGFATEQRAGVVSTTSSTATERKPRRACDWADAVEAW